MNTKLLSISLALVTSVLVACGGGGDARSPDRPAPSLDPDSLRVDLPFGDELAGLGTNKVADGISARMVGLQTDGVETDLGPELNVTEGTTWTITGPIGNPAIAGLAASVRNINGLGNVKDILSTAFLAEPSGKKTLRITGTYRHKGVTYTRFADFTVVPPTRVGPPFIEGPEIIPFDPLQDSNATEEASYELSQKLKDVAKPENRTGEAKFCANKAFFTFADYAEGQTSALATISNPFNSSNSQESITVTISTISPNDECETLYDDVTDNNAPIFAVKTVKIVPATVKSVDVCVITNPPSATCKNSGELDQTIVPTTSCDGLDSATTVATEATVPAGEMLQMVAKLTYQTSDVNANFSRYQCSGAGVLSWSANPTAIYSNNSFSTTAGTATLIGQAAYNQLRNDASNNNSLVTGSYKNSSSSNPVTGNLRLKLTDATVDSITIRPVDNNGTVGPARDDKKYQINYSLLQKDQSFVAFCKYADPAIPEARCGDSTIKWTVGSPTILKVAPVQDVMTKASPATPNAIVNGESTLTATYKNSTLKSDQVTVKVIDDSLVALYLLQQQDDPAQPAVVDQFSCLGSGNYSISASQENGFDFSMVPGSRQFKAHALLKSAVDAGANPETVNPADLSILEDVTDVASVIFTADVGYYDSANKTCVVAPITESLALPEGSIPTGTPLDPVLVPLSDALGSGVPALPLDELPLDLGNAGKPAEFSAEKNGLLVTQGDARLGTMCIRVYVDADDNQAYTPAKPAEGGAPAVNADPLSKNGASVLIQPAGTIALQEQAGSACQIFDPLLSANDDLSNQLLLPALFNLGYFGDPAISALPVGDLINQIPVDALLDAILTGDFSAIPGADQLPPPPSDLEGVQAIVEGLIATLTDSGGEGLPTDDAIAAITNLIAMIPGSDAINPDDLTSELEALNPAELAATLAAAITNAAEEAGIPLGDPDLSALTDLLDTLGLGALLPL